MSLAASLRAGDATGCLAAMETVAARAAADPDEVDALVECLGHARKLVQRRAAGILADLGRHDAAVGARLEAALASPDGRRRWGAAYALARLDAAPARLLPVLLETMGDADGDLRWAAADIVVGFADRAAVLGALRDCAGTGNAAQRKMVLYCLRDLDDRTPEGAAVALGALADPDQGVRLAAVAATARLAVDRPSAARRLIGVLEQGDPALARAGAAALGALGEVGTEVTMALARAEASPDAALRRAAGRSLRMLRER